MKINLTSILLVFSVIFSCVGSFAQGTNHSFLRPKSERRSLHRDAMAVLQALREHGHPRATDVEINWPEDIFVAAGYMIKMDFDIIYLGEEDKLESNLAWELYFKEDGHTYNCYTRPREYMSDHNHYQIEIWGCIKD